MWKLDPLPVEACQGVAAMLVLALLPGMRLLTAVAGVLAPLVATTVPRSLWPPPG